MCVYKKNDFLKISVDVLNCCVGLSHNVCMDCNNVL